MRSAADRLPSLTGLRFVAAFAVFGFHVNAQAVLPEGWTRHILEGVFAGGATGVGFFFILSGFVLTWSARRADSVRAIWQRRAARIVPNHLVAWLLAFAGMLAAGKTVAAWSSVPSLLLVQAWFPAEEVFFAVNTPSWSLSCELAFYAAFPTLLPLVRRIPVGRLWHVAALLVAGVMLVPVVALGLPDAMAYWFVWVFPGTRLLEFILGMVLARIVRDGRWIRMKLWIPTGLVVGGYLLAPHLPAGSGFVAATVVPFALLIPAVAAADLTRAPSPRRSGPMVLLGELSFAFYLLHQIIIRGIDQALGDREWPVMPGLAVIVAMLLVSLAASWLLNMAVERPAVRLLTPRRTASGAVDLPPLPAVLPGQLHHDGAGDPRKAERLGATPQPNNP